MWNVNRLIYAAAISLLALTPLTASATPSPSPGLETVLAAPPSGYAELTSSPFHGLFTAHDYAQALGSADADQIEKTLNHDGFVSGFGKTWVHQVSGHALVEAVLAFTGAKGAKTWLTQAEAGDKKDPAYAHADSISGISPYYGVHFKSADSTGEGDAFSFVKGNDVFLVDAVSTKDDVLDLATSQTQAQYNSAPNQTIPSSQWPENASAGGRSIAYWVGYITIPLLIAVLALLGFLIVRSRRRPATTAAVGGAGGMVQMSNDGHYWWDGQTWRDAAREVPPNAQRSSDGALWWDGQTWHPVAPTGSPAPPADTNPPPAPPGNPAPPPAT
jgi:hypothetical protein